MSAHTSDFAQLGYSISRMAVWALGLQVTVHKITLSTSQLKKKKYREVVTSQTCQKCAVMLILINVR